MLFTRDLRVHDNPALAAAAAAHDEVVPLFILDDRLLSRASGVRRRFLDEALADLRASLRSLGAPLVVRSGNPVEETMSVAAEIGAESVFAMEDVSAYAQRREDRLRRACDRERIRLSLQPGVTVVPPGDLVPDGSAFYRVFTPYWRRGRESLWRAEEPAPRALFGTRLRGLTPTPISSAGERAGRERVERWLATASVAEPSRLGAYLHFGCLSPLALARRVRETPTGESFLRKLCWRDFFHQLLHARPELATADLRPGRRWRDDAAAFEAWREGQTGYPYVDAAMRQLASEGWIDNRARLVTASFLTKHLGLDWRLGADHFFATLVDGDVAQNVGNWQWVAGTGTDTRPRRFLNPTLQAKRHDPGGGYIRRWVPELASVDGAAVHEPWTVAPSARNGYPDRIVDHMAARERFLTGSE